MDRERDGRRSSMYGEERRVCECGSESSRRYMCYSFRAHCVSFFLPLLVLHQTILHPPIYDPQSGERDVVRSGTPVVRVRRPYDPVFPAFSRSHSPQIYTGHSHPISSPPENAYSGPSPPLTVPDWPQGSGRPFLHRPYLTGEYHMLRRHALLLRLD